MTSMRIALIAALLCTCATRAFSQEMEKVTVTLESGVFGTRLPFDVPILVEGTIATTVEVVSASYALLPNEPEALLDCEDTSLVWRRGGTWRRQQGRTATVFQLTLPRLQANRYYCINFSYGPPYRGPQPRELAAFRAAALEAIDLAMRPVTGPERFDLGMATRLRLALIDAIERASGGAAVDVPSTSIFSREMDPARAADAFTDFLRLLLSLQETRTNQIRTFRNDLAAARKVTGSIPRADYDRLIAVAGAGAAASSADREARAALTSLRDFAFGGAALPGLEEDVRDALEATWDPTAIDSRILRLSRTESSLALLDTWLAALTPAQLKSADPGAGQARDALRKSLPDTQGLLGRMRSALATIVGELSRRTAVLEKAVDDLTLRLLMDVRMLASTVGNFSTRHSWYISADLGLAYAPVIDEIFPYLGTNIYFRPVNKAAPLSSLGGFGQTFTRRASAMIGITFGNSEITETNRRAPLFNSQYLLLGGGFRMTDAIRLASGILVMKASDPNPLVTDRQNIEATWFISFSFDWDVRGTFTKAFGFSEPPGQPEQ
jgi:hypothetical protein